MNHAIAPLALLVLAACTKPAPQAEAKDASPAPSTEAANEEAASSPETPGPQPSMFVDAIGTPAEPEACYAYAAETCKWLRPPRPDCPTEVQTVLVKAKIDAGVCSVALKSLALVESDEPNVKPSAAARFLQEALLTSPDVDLAAARAAMTQSH